jgi:hypothetical protein
LRETSCQRTILNKKYVIVDIAVVQKAWGSYEEAQ